MCHFHLIKGCGNVFVSRSKIKWMVGCGVALQNIIFFHPFFILRCSCSSCSDSCVASIQAVCTCSICSVKTLQSCKLQQSVMPNPAHLFQFALAPVVRETLWSCTLQQSVLPSSCLQLSFICFSPSVALQKTQVFCFHLMTQTACACSVAALLSSSSPNSHLFFGHFVSFDGALAPIALTSSAPSNSLTCSSCCTKTLWSCALQQSVLPSPC